MSTDAVSVFITSLKTFSTMSSTLSTVFINDVENVFA